jgi:hypothetical protein
VSAAVAVEVCALCGSNGPLCESHIIPHFVFDWLKETSATGYMRHAQHPNLRVQDGMKERLLCADCEGRLSVWEKHAAEIVFGPYHRDSSATIRYGASFARFCASVCWRVLAVFRRIGLDHLSGEQRLAVDKALDVWREFMFGERENPGQFELHLYPVDVTESLQNIDAPPNFNRYLARVVECAVGANSDSAFVYVKMGKLLLFGLIQEPDRRYWKGGRVAMRAGKIVPGSEYHLPQALAKYIPDRAARVRRIYDEMSERQKDKVEATMRGDLDRAANSELFKAMTADVNMFGQDAFRETEAPESPKKK